MFFHQVAGALVFLRYRESPQQGVGLVAKQFRVLIHDAAGFSPSVGVDESQQGL